MMPEIDLEQKIPNKVPFVLALIALPGRVELL
jgi:hypothetical protein